MVDRLQHAIRFAGVDVILDRIKHTISFDLENYILNNVNPSGISTARSDMVYDHILHYIKKEGRRMTIKIHADSHLDHDIPVVVWDYVLNQFSDRDSFFAETFTYPEELPGIPSPTRLPEIPCALHFDVPEDEVFYAVRDGDKNEDGTPKRTWKSRLCTRPPRMVREVTILAGPHPTDKEAGMVLYTMYGGPAAPQEPGDPDLPEHKKEDAESFWKTSALSAGK